MSLRIGDLELQSVSGGQLWMDGGSMFGVVPKVLWQRKCPPDDQNRILLETNCLLVRSPSQTILIDTGYGAKASEREREHYAIQSNHSLLENLAKIGVGPDDIDRVILTHLHFDHAGGCTVHDDSGQPVPAFPNARYVIQQNEWDDATDDLPELAGSYLKRDFMPLEEADQLELIHGDVELLPGLSTHVTAGHTRGHQMIHLSDGDQHAIYTADLCPSSAHLPAFWSTAYEQDPLHLRRIKPAVLGEAVDNHWLVMFDHDPQVKAAYLGRDARREFVVQEVVAM